MELISYSTQDEFIKAKHTLAKTIKMIVGDGNTRITSYDLPQGEGYTSFTINDVAYYFEVKTYGISCEIVDPSNTVNPSAILTLFKNQYA